MQKRLPKGFEDSFSHNVNYEDSFRQCLEVGKKYIDYDRKKAEFAKETGPIRHGIGVATFWYITPPSTPSRWRRPPTGCC